MNTVVSRWGLASLLFAGAADAQLFTDVYSPTGIDILDTFVGDVDGDGRDDVVVMSILDDGAVLRGGSDGRLEAAVPFPASAVFSSSGCTLADVDGDGRSDLVCTGTSPSGQVAVVRRGGPGATWGPEIVSPLSSGVPLAFTLADANNDGRADLWVMDDDSPRVARMLGQADGTFGPEELFVVTTANPGLKWDVGVGDVSGDGVLDLAVQFSGGLTTLALGTGSGFGTAQVIIAAADARIGGFGLADLTSDGVLDVVSLGSVGSAGPALAVVPGGSDVLTNAPVFIGGTSVEEWRAADVDEDGRTDIVALRGGDVDENGGQITVLRQVSDGVFGAPVMSGVRGSQSFGLADIDLDGALDVIGHDGQSLRIARGVEGETFGASLPPVNATNSLFDDVVFGDVDGDGRCDAVTWQQHTSGVLVIREGSLELGWGAPSTLPLGSGVLSLALGAVDTDGDVDIVVHQVGRLWSYVNDGSGGFPTIVENTINVFTSGSGIADVTNDGILDVVSLNNDISVTLHTGQGDGHFVQSTLGLMPVFGSVDTIGDIDGDGIDEVIAGGSQVVVIDGVSVTSIGSFVGLSTVDDIQLLDVDGDGDLDLIGSRKDTQAFEVLVNDGATFSAGPLVTTTFFPNDLDAYDIDGDGDDDLLVVEAESTGLLDPGRISAWIVDGSGSLSTGPVIDLPIAPRRVRLVDIDNDGLIDALANTINGFVLLPNIDATWRGLGESLSGSSGRSGLGGYGELTSDGTVTLIIDRMQAFTSTFLVVGFSELAAPLKGGVLVPAVDILFDGLVTDATGRIEVPTTLPPAIPADVEIYLQAWQPDIAGGFTATTALLGTTR